MNCFKLAFPIAAAVAICFVASAQAANIALSVNYAGSYDSSFNPLPGSPPAPLNSQNAPHSGAPGAVHVPGAYHQFDVFMALSNMAAGEDFQTTTLDFVLGPGVTNSDAGWVGDAPLNDPAGPPGNEPVFSSGDFGVAGDLKGIGVVANNGNGHIRTHNTQPGEAGGTLGSPTKVGSAYVFWDGTFGPDNKSWVALSYPQNTASAFSTVILNVGSAWPPANFSVGPREEWVSAGNGPVFEVDSLDLLSGRLPGSTITAGPLGTNDADDPDNGIAWLLESLTGPGGAVLGATVNPTTGVFTWNSPANAAKGAYTALIRGTNDDTPAGTNTGNLTFDIVPEPATMSLLGLAMLGMLGVTRRR